jgi:hypothetical protein
MPDIVTTKHTIEVEIEVEWDWDDSTQPHRVKVESLNLNGWATPGQFEAFGITRPAPSYEPQVGDIVIFVENGDGYYRISRANPGGKDFELKDGVGRVKFTKAEPDGMRFIARPEAKS